jgi:N-acetylneuraminate synthase/N,N'-diacetyllegionaminate synthase
MTLDSKGSDRIYVGRRALGIGEPCLIVAEAGVNHNGDVDIAHRLIDAAAEAKADAVKFQTFTASRVVTEDAPMAAYQAANVGAAGSQYSMLSTLELPRSSYVGLKGHADQLGLIFLSTPFDEDSAAFLIELGVPAIKVSSGDLTHTPFLAELARHRRPLLVSTGMGSRDEVADAVGVVTAAQCPLALLHCVSAYPAPVDEVNLRAMHTLRTAFGVPVGYSDHTLGTAVALAAVALGAAILEKHLTLDRSSPGPDHRASIEPPEFRRMVDDARAIECSLGSGEKVPAPSEAETLRIVRRSLFAARSLPAGKPLIESDLIARRPAIGLAPSALPHVVGRRLRRGLDAGQPLHADDLE